MLNSNIEIIDNYECKNLDLFLNWIRIQFGLSPKNDFSSNFIFTDKTLELAHILRNSTQEIFEELEDKSSSNNKISNNEIIY